jgi:hypothetical protein
MQDSFQYCIPATRHVVGLTLCTSLAVTVGYFAAGNKVGIHGFKSMSFSAQEASIIFFGVALLFALGAAGCIMMLRRSLKGPIRLSLESDSVLTPRSSLKGELLNIPYTAIQKVSLHSVQTQQLLVIDSSVGRSRLSSIGFTSELEFVAFYEALAKKIAERSRPV